MRARALLWVRVGVWAGMGGPVYALLAAVGRGDRCLRSGVHLKKNLHIVAATITEDGTEVGSQPSPQEKFPRKLHLMEIREKTDLKFQKHRFQIEA